MSESKGVDPSQWCEHDEFRNECPRCLTADLAAEQKRHEFSVTKWMRERKELTDQLTAERAKNTPPSDESVREDFTKCGVHGCEYIGACPECHRIATSMIYLRERAITDLESSATYWRTKAQTLEESLSDVVQDGDYDAAVRLWARETLETADANADPFFQRTK